MLSYDICRKLKEAGYERNDYIGPHGGFYCRDELNDRPPQEPYWAQSNEYAHSPLANAWHDLACPNSDELIAAIQARFNVYPWLTTVPNQPCEAGAINEDEFDLVVAHGSTFITGNSPAEALAALYLALAEVTPC